MTLKQAIDRCRVFQLMIGQKCQKCNGVIKNVIVMPISGEHGQKMDEYFAEEITYNFDLKRAEEKDRDNNGLDWGVYFLCVKDVNQYCYETAWSIPNPTGE